MLFYDDSALLFDSSAEPGALSAGYAATGAPKTDASHAAEKLIIKSPLENARRRVLCTVLKNEARFVKEWIEFHHDLGFDKIRIYDDNQFHGITSRRY